MEYVFMILIITVKSVVVDINIGKLVWALILGVETFIKETT